MIGIITAMKQELDAIRADMTVEKEESIAGIKLCYGKLAGKDVVALQSGVGKVMTGMAATIACMETPLDALINVGVAGGLDEDQSVLDIVISTSAVQADYDTSPLDGESGLGLFYLADDTLVDNAVEVLKQLDVPYHLGMVASQDLFMSREEDMERLLEDFPESACSEMEGAAIAAVANAFNVPFLIIRSLSDVVSHEGNHMEFNQFVNIASQRAALIVEALCRKL